MDDRQAWVRLGPWALRRQGSDWWVYKLHDEAGHGWGVTSECQLGLIRQRTREDLGAALLAGFPSEVPRPSAERLVDGMVTMLSPDDLAAL